MDYEDFPVSISRHENGLRVVVDASPSGDGSEVSPLSVSAHELERLANALEGERSRDFEPLVGATPPEQGVRQLLADVGEKLSKALFPTRVLELWSATYGRGVQSDQPLRFSLRMNLSCGGDDLHALPWEAAHDAVGSRALAQGGNLSFVRHLLRRGAPPPLLRADKLVVLTVAAQCSGRPLLRLDDELEALHRALDGSSVEIEQLSRPTLARLDQRLSRGDIHVVHFLGHGTFDPRRQRGVVYFEAENGEPHEVCGERLAATLRDRPSLRLLFLNACRTAEAARQAPFAGIATAAVRHAGLPAVLAMQYPVRDRASALFAESVYSRLAEDGDLDAAVAEGRRQLHLRSDEVGEGAWVVPVFFSRLPGSALFERTVSRAWTTLPSPLAAAAPRADAAATSPAGLALFLRRWGRAASLTAVALLVGALLWRGSPSLGPLHAPAGRHDGDPGTTVERADDPATGGGAAEAVVAPGETFGAPRSTRPAVEEDEPRGPAQMEADGELTLPPPPEPPAADAEIKPRLLTEDQPLYFAPYDAWVSATFRRQGRESYVSLDLALAGKSSPPKAVMGHETVRFDTSRGLLALTVVGIDERRRELQVLPLRSVSN